MMERASTVLPQKAPRYRGARGPTQRSANEWPANTPPMMERVRTVLPQKAPRYRGARGPTTKIS